MKQLLFWVFGMFLFLNPNLSFSQRCDCQLGPNLVANGDFSLGNTGFGSDLTFDPGCALASYSVVNQPSTKCAIAGWTTGLWDNTVGTPAGSQLVIDSDNRRSLRVWFNTNTISVSQGTLYRFSFWHLKDISDVSDQTFQIRINGQVVETINTNGAQGQQWNEYCVIWNSPNNGTVDLEIWQMVPPGGMLGNQDHAIDDVYFGLPTINLLTSNVVNASCSSSNGSIDLEMDTLMGQNTFQWSGPFGFQAFTEDVSNVPPGIYEVRVTNDFGCIADLQFTVGYDELPEHEIVGDTIKCQSMGPAHFSVLNAYTNYTYKWVIPGATPRVTFGTTATVNWSNLGSSVVRLVATHNPTGCKETVYYEVEGCCFRGDNPNRFDLNNTSVSWIKANLLSGSNQWTTPFEININGTLSIDQDFSFLNCPNIYLGEGARIEIDPGINLTINDSKLQPCGEVMWEGIYIANSTAKFISNQTEFISAENAVVSQAGGQYFINECTFTNNYIGIDVQAYMNDAHLDFARVQNSTFQEIGGYLLPPHDDLWGSLVGVRVTDVHDSYNYQGGAGIEVGPNNSYLGQYYGVQTIRSLTLIQDSYFAPNFGYSGGVYSVGHNGSGQSFVPETQVYNCHFDHLDNIGVEARKGQILSVVDCRLEDASIVAEDVEIDLAHIAITDNTFTHSGNRRSYGAMVLRDNPECFITIARNTLDAIDMHNGIYIVDWNFNQTRATIYENVIKGPTLGIVIGGLAGFFNGYNVEIIDNYIETGPYDPSFNTNGILTMSTLHTYIAHNVINLDGNFNPYTYGVYNYVGADLDVFCNRVIDGEVGFYLSGGFADINFTRNIMDNPVSGLYLKNTPLGTQGVPGEPADNQWLPAHANIATVSDGSSGAMHVRPLPAYYPSSNIVFPIASGVGMIPDYSSPPYNNCPVKLGDSHAKKDPLRVADNFTNDLPAQLDQLEAKFKIVTDSNQLERLREMTFLQYADQKEELSDFAKTLVNRMEKSSFGSLIRLNKRVHVLQPSAILTQLNLINPKTESEHLMKNFLELQAQITANEEKPTAAQLNALEEIAYLCPHKKGLAVFQARMYLQQFEENPKEYVNDCERNKKVERHHESIESEKIQIHPNPVDEILWIENLPETTKEILLVNVFGQKVPVTVEDVGEEAYIDLSLQQSGIYILTIVDDEITKEYKIIKH